MIPVVLVVDFLLLIVAGIADTSIARTGDTLGHPAPVFLLLVVIIGGGITVILTLRALILCVRSIIRNRT